MGIPNFTRPLEALKGELPQASRKAKPAVVFETHMAAHDSIEKIGDNFAVRRYFDGKHGIPEMTMWLDHTGTWASTAYLFTSIEWATGVYKMRLKCEARWRELNHLAMLLAMRDDFSLPTCMKADCEEFNKMYNEQRKALGRK